MAADLQQAVLAPSQPALHKPQSAAFLWHWLRRYWLSSAGIFVLTAIVALTVAAPATARHDPLKIDPINKLQGPSLEYLMGTDDLGRSIWARVVWGARLTLGTATLAQLIMTGIGVTLGLVAGFYGGWLDNVIMRAVDIVLAVPSLILALAIAGMLGPSLVNVLIGIVAVAWAEYARLVRGMVLSVRECEYVEAANALGCSRLDTMRRHILPNIISPVLVFASLNMGGLLLSISALSFLGLGAQAPQPEWGRMLSDARPYMQTAPHTMLFPGLMIFLCVMAFNLLGDELRDVLDPQAR